MSKTFSGFVHSNHQRLHRSWKLGFQPIALFMSGGHAATRTILMAYTPIRSQDVIQVGAMVLLQLGFVLISVTHVVSGDNGNHV